MIASLAMYDRPQLRPAHDALWAAIRDALRDGGRAAPDHLARGGDLWSIWQDPALVLAHCCGLPYRARLHPRVALVATPDYALPGCPPGYYNSVILARQSPLPARPTIAVNDPLSQSGWAALHRWLADRGLTHGAVVMTGAHAQSARAVAEGKADLAAIDAQSWRHILRYDRADPALEIARTPPTPGLPLITAQDPAPLRAALTQAFDHVGRDVLGALDLAGVVQIPPASYLALPQPPNPAPSA